MAPRGGSRAGAGRKPGSGRLKDAKEGFLAIRIEPELLEQARAFAVEARRPLSAIVRDLLKDLVASEMQPKRARKKPARS